MGMQKYFKFLTIRRSKQDSSRGRRKWSERIKDTYKLTIRNSDTLEVVSSFELTLLNLYVLLSSILVITGILVWLLLAYTPLKHYLPGMRNTATSDEVAALNKTIRDLEKEMQANLSYQEVLKRRILGENRYADSTHAAKIRFTKEQLNVPKSDAEKKLEQEVKRGTFFNDAQNQTDKQTVAGLKQMQFVSPVIGEVSAGFNPGKQHFGVDIIAPKNTPIKAIAEGVVVFSDWSMETGNTIVIKHSNDLISVYKHNKKLLKKTGEIVKPGEAIAIIGNTGTLTSGPHLHFELWYRQKPLNPMEFVRFE